MLIIKEKSMALIFAVKLCTTIPKINVAVKTCGLPRITSVMRNLTLDPGDTAR